MAKPKKKEINLHPFKFTESIEVTEKCKEKNIFEPSNIKDIIGLDACAYILNEWYNKNIKGETNKLLLLVGPVGCGKTSLIELYCKENSIQLYTVKSSDIVKTKKDLLKDIFSFTQYTSTQFFLKNQN